MRDDKYIVFVSIFILVFVLVFIFTLSDLYKVTAEDREIRPEVNEGIDFYLKDGEKLDDIINNQSDDVNKVNDLKGD